MSKPAQAAATKSSSYYTRWFGALWKDDYGFAFLLVVLTFISTGVAMLFPLFFRHLINTLSKDMGTVTAAQGYALRRHYLLMLLGLGVFRLVAGLYPAFRARMNYVFERAVRCHFFSGLLEKDHRFFLHFRTGDVVTRLTDDISGFPKIAWFACSGLFRALNSGCIVLACVGAMLWLNPTLALVAILPLPAAHFIFTSISTRLRRAHDENRAHISRTTSHLESCLAGVRILKAYGAEDREGERFEEVLGERFKKEMEVVHLSSRLYTFFNFAGFAAQVLVVLVGGGLVRGGSLTLGDYYAFFAYLGVIVYPLIDIPNLLVTSRAAFVCVDRLEELRSTGEEGGEACRGTREVDSIETIRFDGVSFRYDDESEPVLSDVNLEVQRGEILAIIGQIGSGKTTLLNLLAGILRPTTGQILINDSPVHELDPVTYRSRLGYIGQDPTVFSETIGQNIRFWRGYEQGRVNQAAGLAQIAGEVEAFPDGYEQVLGQRGVDVSGGQKQRITIARAVVGEPELLVMDDVTASLDADGEEAFWNDLQREGTDRTVIIVTHRLATVRRADRIVVLKDGQVETVGTYGELIRDSKAFREVLNLSLIG